MNITKETIEDIYSHALETYPDECCGIVTGKDAKQTVHKCVNIQNKLNADDPQRYPRDAKTAYAIDRTAAETIYTGAKEKGENVIAFYHSHIDCDAYFSQTDKEAQIVFGEPEFPAALQIVVSVIKKQVCGIKAFKWDGEKNDFISLPLE
jgi:proteasome lid subunit RPN8/RPN11